MSNFSKKCSISATKSHNGICNIYIPTTTFAVKTKENLKLHIQFAAAKALLQNCAEPEVTKFASISAEMHHRNYTFKTMQKKFHSRLYRARN